MNTKPVAYIAHAIYMNWDISGTVYNSEFKPVNITDTQRVKINKLAYKKLRDLKYNWWIKDWEFFDLYFDENFNLIP